MARHVGSMKRIVFFCPHPVEDSGYRYRIQQYLPYLEQAGYQCTVWPFSTGQLFGALQARGRLSSKVAHSLYCTARRALQLALIRRFDLVVIHREVFPFLMPMWERLVMAQGRKVVFSFDDAIYTNHPDLRALNHALLYRLKYGRGVDEVLRRSRHIVAGNRILAEYARRHNPQVSVFPTVVDCRRYSFRLSTLDPDGLLTIGWMGSRSTAPYLTPILPALRRLVDAYPERVRFRFFGHPSSELDLPNSACVPFRLETEMADLSSIDIGLMPLPNTEWTRGKCAFKAIQYMATGIPSVCSPVGVTSELIADGVNGFLANSTEDWFRCLQALVSDPELRRRMSLAGRRTIEEGYCVQQWGPRFACLLTELLDEQPVHKTESTVETS